MIAASHPGKLGDALYALPAIQMLCIRHGCQCDFYTSAWCEPLRPLMLRQQCIRDFIVPKEYVEAAHSIGIQPWSMPIDASKYEAVYQLGYKSFPEKFLAEHISEDAGVPFVGMYLEDDNTKLDGDYYVICSRTTSDGAYYYYKTPTALKKFAANNRCYVLGVRPPHEPFPEAQYIPCNLLECAGIIKNSNGFVGQGSIMHTIATFYNIKRCVLLLPFSDTRHLYQSPNDRFFSPPILHPERMEKFLRK